jgi:hypothetical protein
LTAAMIASPWPSPGRCEVVNVDAHQPLWRNAVQTARSLDWIL